MAMPFAELVVWLVSLGFFYSLSSKHVYFELVFSLLMVVFLAQTIRYDLMVQIPTGWHASKEIDVIDNTTTAETYNGNLQYTEVDIKWIVYFLFGVTFYILFDVIGKTLLPARGYR